MARDQIDPTHLESRDDLVRWLEAGCKAPEEFRIGTEHEKFPFRRTDLSPVHYEGPRGIQALLEGMQGLLGWEPIFDEGRIIGLYDVTGGGAISLEPGGQFELSGAPLETLHQTCSEFYAHLAQVREVAEPLGVGFLGLGMSPKWTLAETPVMPKGRYAIMTRYMPKVGSRGLDMMYRTSTVQVNLDFSSEADMVKKMRVGLALQPIATALFANSPFTEGKPNGFLSYRAHVWTDTDNQRSGMPALMFAEDFGFERYVDWVLDVPMYFVMRDGEMIDLAGQSFRRFMAGDLADTKAGRATIGDFADHVTTVFTDVRLKRFLEMRGADAGSLEMMVAQSALWVGLLYDEAALAAAGELVRRLDWSVYAGLRPLVARQALNAPVGNGTVRDLAREMVAIAEQGLRARARLDAQGRDETIHLAPLRDMVAGGPTQAERWLERFNGEWAGDVTQIFTEAAI